MADNKPFRYRDTLPSKLDDKDVQDTIRFQLSRNNIKELETLNPEKLDPAYCIQLHRYVFRSLTWSLYPYKSLKQF